MLKKNFDQQQDFLQADTADTIPRTQSTLSYTFKCFLYWFYPSNK